MQRNFNAAALTLVLSAALCQSVVARGNDLVFSDGQGEQITLKHGFFGRGTAVVKDRFGDGFGQKKGFFGTKQTQMSVLGNGFTSKTGILGGNNIQGSTIFGDRVQTKKGIFGRRTTYINAGGSANMLRALFNSNKPNPQGQAPGNPLAPGALSVPGLPGPAGSN